jgi:hypothetical protein
MTPFFSSLLQCSVLFFQIDTIQKCQSIIFFNFILLCFVLGADVGWMLQVLPVWSTAAMTLGVCTFFLGPWAEKAGPRIVGVAAATSYGIGCALSGQFKFFKLHHQAIQQKKQLTLYSAVHQQCTVH